MNTEQPQDTSVKQESKSPLQDAALKQKEVPEVVDFLRENGLSALIGVGLAVILFLGYSAYKNYKRTAVSTAFSTLFSAQSADQIQGIINQYPSTPAAPLAHLALASQHFDAGQYDLAQYVYAEFETKFPEHALRAAAELGKAQCLEAAGQVEQALQAFVVFSQTQTNHYLAPLAQFGQARCYEQLGRYDEARAVYEDYIAAHPDDEWSERAETALLFVDKAKRTAAAATATK